MKIPQSKRFAFGLVAALIFSWSGLALAALPAPIGNGPYARPATSSKLPTYNNGVSDTATGAHLGCTIPSQRDASCLGFTGAPGTNNTDNSTLSLDPRGGNARRVPGLTMPAPATVNSCVSMPATLWSWRGTPQSFITPSGGGFLGSGGAGDPTLSCSSPTDGSCTTWVPATHKFLFIGGKSFLECGATPNSGSVSCPTKGSNALVTTNAATTTNFQAYMVACRTGLPDAGVIVVDSPFESWSNCAAGGPSCSYVVYDPNAYASGL